MKTIPIILLTLCANFTVKAQLLPDQNPNYNLSRAKYVANNQLQSNMNSTVQDTYKAYDWRTAKEERKLERQNYRRQSRLYNNYNYTSPYYNFDYGNGYYQGNSIPYRQNRIHGNLGFGWIW